jgi:hypothetical protein
LLLLLLPLLLLLLASPGTSCTVFTGSKHGLAVKLPLCMQQARHNNS